MKVLLIWLGFFLALLTDFTVVATGKQSDKHDDDKFIKGNKNSKGLKQDLEHFQPGLMKKMEENQKKPPPPEEGATCPNTVLCHYVNGGGSTPVFKKCDKAVVLADIKSFDVGQEQEWSSQGFIHFLTIPKQHIQAIWHVTDASLIKDMRDCWHEFINEHDSGEKLLDVEEKKLKEGNSKGKERFDELKKKSGGKFTISDFVDFFHVPPGINHLHMHVVLGDGEYRKYSSPERDQYALLTDNALQVMAKSKPDNTDYTGTGKEEGGKDKKDEAKTKVKDKLEGKGKGKGKGNKGAGNKGGQKAGKKAANNNKKKGPAGH